ncbi:MAG TPA: ABC transporter permease [Steroidobacteraceae bacterium]|nr:ABC transporter permease [Steroidobacteraceae bacterium]
MRFLSNLLTLLAVIAAVIVLIAAPWPLLLGATLCLGAWLWMTRVGRQTASVTAIGVRTLTQRAGASFVIIIGIGGVVAVLVALLAMAEGYSQTLRRTGSADSAVVLRGGSSAEVNSVLAHDDALVIAEAPGVAHDAAGKPITSAELVVAANLPIKKSRDPNDLGSVQLRGIGPDAWRLRTNARIISGEKFRPGLRELVVGRGAQRQFAGLEVGREVKLGSQLWKVVGVFETRDALESEVWADATDVGAAYRRGSSLSSVFVRLTDPGAYNQFKAALGADPRLKVDVSTTTEYYSKQSETITKVIRIIGLVVGAIMAIGAVFGALNTMFAAVATRAREIATLRAIGFRGLAVVVAVMIETMLLALLGGALGGLLAWLVFNGFTASSIAGGVGQLTFDFKVTGPLLWTGMTWALAIGVIGGLYPALRAARLPVASALRDN